MVTHRSNYASCCATKLDADDVATIAEGRKEGRKKESGMNLTFSAMVGPRRLEALASLAVLKKILVFFNFGLPLLWQVTGTFKHGTDVMEAC